MVVLSFDGRGIVTCPEALPEAAAPQGRLPQACRPPGQGPEAAPQAHGRARLRLRPDLPIPARPPTSCLIATSSAPRPAGAGCGWQVAWRQRHRRRRRDRRRVRPGHPPRPDHRGDWVVWSTATPTSSTPSTPEPTPAGPRSPSWSRSSTSLSTCGEPPGALTAKATRPPRSGSASRPTRSSPAAPGRSHPEAPRPAHQRRLRLLLAVPPPPGTTASTTPTTSAVSSQPERHPSGELHPI